MSFKITLTNNIWSSDCFLIIICLLARCSWLRFKLLDLRLHRYLKKSSKLEYIRTYILECKLGDWFVMYQLSKNLNRPFFIDFLTAISVKYVKNDLSIETETDAEDTGDSILTMLLKPSYTTQETQDSDRTQHLDTDPEEGGS